MASVTALSPESRFEEPLGRDVSSMGLRAILGLCALALAACSSQGGGPRRAVRDDDGSTVVTGSDLAHIHEIQGRAHRSPFDGDEASVVGVVTVVRERGFYLQSTDRDADGDDATSEGLFVFTKDTPSVSEGNLVRVTGRVAEYRPGCSDCDPSSSAYANLSTTQLEAPTRIELLRAVVDLPRAERLGPGGRQVPPVMNLEAKRVDVEAEGAELQPARVAIDFFEGLEGMLVELPEPVAIGPTSAFGELPVLVQQGEGAGLRTERGGILRTAEDSNPERLTLVHPSMPEVSVGDSFGGSVRAAVDYDYGAFKLLSAGPLPPVVGRGIRRERTALGDRGAGELTIATFNVEGLDAGDGATRFAELADVIVRNLGAPDLVALEEVQDDSGPSDDGTVSADRTLSLLTGAIGDAGGPPYDHAGLDPKDGADGGEPGGNIRVVLLFRTDRGLSLVERVGADAKTENDVVLRSGTPGLRFSPGLVEPSNPAFGDGRKPLAAEFRFEDETLFVLAVHFCSKIGDEPLFGRFQPPAERSAAQRQEQASVVGAFVKRLLSVDPGARLVVLGDMNDTEFAPPVTALREAGASTVISRLPASERYSYIYQGNSQALDHILVSSSLGELVNGVDIVHVGAEFSDRVSDHDPVLLRLGTRE